MKVEIRTLKFLILSTLLLLSGIAAWAQDVQLSIQPQLISLMDRAVLKVEFINTDGDSVEFPQIDGLKIQYQGKSSQTQIVNFKTTRKTVHSYIVTPSKVGDFTIGPVNVTYKGGNKELSTFLRVIKPENDQEAQEISELMFSEISSDRIAPHVHEPFGLTLKVYIKDGVQIDGSFAIRGGMPESGLDGELQWEVIDRKRQEVDGSIFNVYTLKSTAKTLTAGTFAFQPQVQMKIVVPRQQRRSYGFDDPFFGDMFGRQETRPIVLDCNKLEVKVRPVPMDGRPESFTGGVGIFDFDVSVGPEAVKAGEPITVKMRIYGKGNISQITPPHIEESNDYKLYDARTVATDNPNEVLFEQVIIPKSEHVTDLPQIAFSYFNTKTTDFRTIKQGPFPVMVEGVPQQAAQVIATVPTIAPKETKVLGRDIVYLKQKPENWNNQSDAKWYQQMLNRILLILPAALLVLIAIITTRRNRLASNVALARRQKAPKVARVHIQRAEKAMRKKDTAGFYAALWDAMADYFGHRLNLPPGDISLQVLCEHIPAESENLTHLFNTIEQRRYGFGNDSTEEMKPLLKQLNAMMRKCERMKL